MGPANPPRRPPAWLMRLADRLRPPRAIRPSAVERRVGAVIARAGHLDEAALCAALLNALDTTPPEPAPPGAFELLDAHWSDDPDPHVETWRILTERTGSDRARASYAVALHRAGEVDRALHEFVAALERDGTLLQVGGELFDAAAERGGEIGLRCRLASLRAALAGLGPDGPDGDDDDSIRELYGELLEEHRGDPAAVERIREVGRLIEAAVSRGDLPRAIVRRAPR